MDNRLKEFEELLLDNALLKVQNQTLAKKTRSGRNGGRCCKKSPKN
jgi:hypothetical protein